MLRLAGRRLSFLSWRPIASNSFPLSRDPVPGGVPSAAEDSRSNSSPFYRPSFESALLGSIRVEQMEDEVKEKEA